MTPEKRLVLLGHIAGAHGIRGEVVVRSYTADPAAISAYGPLSDEHGERRLELEVVRVTEKGVIARVTGISDRTAAERLKGRPLHVARERLPPPAADEYYHADLVGLEVRSPGGGNVGVVQSVANFGAGDLLEIRQHGETETVYVPLRKAFVPAIDIAAGYLEVLLPDGSAASGEDEN